MPGAVTLSDEMQVISLGTEAEQEAHSGLDGSGLAERLCGKRLFAGGPAKPGFLVPAADPV